jgi:RNase P/RNase MRP subunit POP5
VVVKSKRGRRRYIAFRTEAATTEDLLHALGAALRGAGVPTFKLIQYDGTMGIVRVRGEDQARAVEALGRPTAGLTITTLAASGTLRTLRERFFRSGER